MLNRRKTMHSGSSFSRRAFLRTAALGAATVSAVASPRPAAAQMRKVNVYMGTTMDYANVWAAKLNGYFEKEGIDASIRLFPSGSTATDAFRAGDAEFVCCGEIPSVRLWKVMGSRYIAPVARDFYSLTLVVKREIKSPADLKGKTIATQTASSLMMMAGLINKQYGLTDADYKITNMEPSDMVISLERGSIDGFLWGSPFEERAKQVSGDKVHVLLRGQDVGFPNSVGLNTRADLVEKERPMVQSFVNGLARASDWCMANKEETSKIIAQALKLELPIARATQVMDFTTRLDQGLYKYFYALGGYMLDRKLIDKPMIWNDYWETSFMKAIDPARVETMKDKY